MKHKSIDDYSKEELYFLHQQDEVIIKLLHQEINDIEEVLRLVNSAVNSGKMIINNNNYCSCDDE